MTERNCIVCKSSLPKKAHKYCSRQCAREVERRASRRTNPDEIAPRPCTECGQILDITPSDPQRVVCSRACSKRRKRRLQLERTQSTWNPDGEFKNCVVCSLLFRARNGRNVHCSENCKRLNEDAKRRQKAAVRAAGEGDRVCRKCGIEPISYRRRVCDGCLVDKNTNKARLAKYGMTTEDYQQMLADQDHRCALCRRHETEANGSLMVDHCHDRGWVRGLLCPQCNTGLGMFRDSIDLLDAAKRYLVSHPTGFKHHRDGADSTQLLMFAQVDGEVAA